MKKIKEFLKQMKKGIFYDAWGLVKKHPKLFLFILLMDVVFLSVSFLLSKGGNLLVNPLIAAQNIMAVNAMLPAYVLALVLVYSLTKYTAMHFVKNMFKKEKFNLKRIGWFYLLNIILIAFALVSVLALMALLKGGVKEEYLTWGTRIILTAWFFFIYAVISSAHSLFMLDFSFKKSLKNSFAIAFGKVNKYYGVYVVSAVLFAVFFSIYYVLGIALESMFEFNAMRFNIFFMILTSILMYLLAAYNRVYFYLIVKSVMKK
jgi:hypothetical protein